MDINFITVFFAGGFAGLLLIAFLLLRRWWDNFQHIKQVREEFAAMDIYADLDPAEFEVEFEHDYSVYVPYWVYALAGRLGMSTEHETSPIPVEETVDEWED